MVSAERLTVTVLVAAALLPPILALILVYRLDRREKEPMTLLIRLFFRGAVAVLPIVVLEIAGQWFAAGFGYNQQLQLFLLYFIIPGFAEEGVKFIVLRKQTWNDPNFDSSFDAIVYAVFVSLGFAAVENIKYVLASGLGTAISRALLSIPGHLAFAVIMGHYYGRAKRNALGGFTHLTERMNTRAWLYAAIIHGLYDYILIAYGGWRFAMYFAVMIVIALKLLFNSSVKDGPIR